MTIFFSEALADSIKPDNSAPIAARQVMELISLFMSGLDIVSAGYPVFAAPEHAYIKLIVWVSPQQQFIALIP